ncbi:RIN4, pathogenic type III effector avirulence factor Avr cleavage site [Quillaja saponaria]|uniref:RIN4, pathogenic type III effector avirulence factor Avr cleavage site n=1 Tax=Quillaja saponaria TaxID=32244 RepID=A0AAD7LSJ0_QUISA|nr:RIN4, pathogenic type III effector avirulence factor Avr cleavage site [Quillaja saponaria]
MHPQKNGRMSVPEFGGWDHKAPGATDYSMVFSRARANKKQQKTDLTDVKPASLGNEHEFVTATHQDDPVMALTLLRTRYSSNFKTIWCC